MLMHSTHVKVAEALGAEAHTHEATQGGLATREH